ncbi:MAG: MogA/MoaB family molybdenum cofactor biosynthesis protein [Christensenellales bacterium]|jgi:molybdopterin adenylyltransferase
MYKYAVVTISDSAAAGARRDISGEEIVKAMSSRGFILTQRVTVPDERELISRELIRLCDDKTDLILTTGGTGFSLRDVTPEATRAVIEREAPGVVEAIRYYSLQYTPRAMLSRAVCGIRGKSVILNLPGSPKAVKEALDACLDSLEHGLEILGGGGECARE